MSSDVTIVEAYTHSIRTVVDGKPEYIRRLYFVRFGGHVETGTGAADDAHQFYHAIYKATPNLAGFDWSAPDGQKVRLVAVPTCDVYLTGFPFPTPMSTLEYRDKVRTWTFLGGMSVDAVYVAGSGANVVLEKEDGTILNKNVNDFIFPDQDLINTTYAPWVFIREPSDSEPDPILIDPLVDRFQFADGTKNFVKEHKMWPRHQFVKVGETYSEVPHSAVMISEFETSDATPAIGYLLNLEIYNNTTRAWDSYEDEPNAVLAHGREKGIQARAYNLKFNYQAGQEPFVDPHVLGNSFQFRSTIWDRFDADDDKGWHRIEVSPHFPDGLEGELDSHGAHYHSTQFEYKYYFPGGMPPGGMPPGGP